MRGKKEKEDVREFVKIAIRLQTISPKLFEGYKNRMIGAIEVQKLLKEKEVS